MTERVVVVTASSPPFAIGTAVTLDSFRAANGWFDGDAIVIADSLDERHRELIGATGRTIFRTPSPDLVGLIDALCAAHPLLASRRMRFYSLDAFSVRGYDRVLFLDSDVVVTGDFAPLLVANDPFVAAPDAATLRGEYRDPISFARTKQASGLACFNAGMMLFSPAQMAHSGIEARLRDGLRPSVWEPVETGHTDQFVLNRCLAGEARLVDSSYNFMVGHHARGFAHAGVPTNEIRMFHFNGPSKPWDASSMIAAALDDAVVHRAWAAWHRALDRLVARTHLQKATSGAHDGG